MRARVRLPAGALGAICVFALLIAGCSSGPGNASAGDPTLTPTELRGSRLFSQYCSSCHATTSGTVVVGPSLAGVAQRAGARVPGMEPAAYLEASILEPEGYLVDGYENLMPGALAEALTQEEIDALVAYLLTLE